MRYYIVTTTKFADKCLEYSTYGATQSNWLVNINVGDTIFLSQFNYNLTFASLYEMCSHYNRVGHLFCHT